VVNKIKAIKSFIYKVIYAFNLYKDKLSNLKLYKTYFKLINSKVKFIVQFL
jgi:hypothetical protein